jgi:membrane-associated phospholipid phosphatase
VEHKAAVMTWAADEHLLMAIVGLAWLGTYLASHDAAARRRADHVALATALSAALPHLIKRAVDRERPDRCVVGPPRHGVPRSGNAYDSFPSGHALHLGAITSALARWVPPSAKPLLWAASAGIATTRLVLLAHWLTDVLAGFALGIGLEAALHRLRSPPGTSLRLALWSPRRSSAAGKAPAQRRR